MASPPRPIPGLTRRRQTFFLTIVKPVDLRAGPEDRYAFRATLGTRDEPIARIKALAIRADLETQWAAERERRRPQPAIAPTAALVDTLAQAVRHAVLIGDDRLRVEPEGLDAALASYEWEGNPSPTERRLILRAWIAEQWVQMVAAGDLSAITLRMELVSGIGAVAANNANNDAIMVQTDANNRNTAEGYRVAQENDRAAAAQAFEKQTDRSRQAARQLSMARVLSAQGGASLDANAINISAAAAEDFSRIDTGLTNTIASNRQQMGALQTQNADALASARVQMKAGNSKLTGDFAGIAATTGAKYFSNATEKWIAEKHVTEAWRKQQAFPWATGTKGMGD